ncbi:hypothetical protein Sar04_04870 [Salinispora arenicola]|uniref:Uncharacterized protein n=1 Tax=Salinispora arenicola TaxID=168697 RepID=A0ABQ4JL88_SALAC|nr:hypothetical protein Sar04_04870 [Salinispora arenicola]
MVNRDRVSLIDSSERDGRWEMSISSSFLPGRPPYDAHDKLFRWSAPEDGPPHEPLLGVELDDQLLLDLGVDHLSAGQRVHEDLHLTRDGL